MSLLAVIILSSLITNQHATAPATCNELLISTSVWGQAVTGVYLAPYAYPLQFIGCPGNGCSTDEFYCSDTSSRLEFGTSRSSSGGALRAMVGNFDSDADWPGFSYGCGNQLYPSHITNAPNDNFSANALCYQLGYESGYVISIALNICPEVRYDGSTWTSDYVSSAGYGKAFICEETSASTTVPTTVPTTYPTTNPPISTSLSSSNMNYNCEDEGDINHLDWNDAMDYAGDNLPQINYDITASAQRKQLSINIELDYLGYSYRDNEYGYGTTYHLGFYSFDGGYNGNNIDEPAICDNRIPSAYKNKTWTEYWQYSEYPYLNGSIGSNDYLAYPSSEYWSTTMSRNQTCSKVQYSATFTWDELYNCEAGDGESKAVDVSVDEKFVNMSGIFFVDVVSPVSMKIDTGYYYKYELLSYPFTISIAKSIQILSATNIFWFTLSVFNIGKNNDEGILRILLLTESAVYAPLTNPLLLSAPNIIENRLTFIFNETDCVSFTSNICSQIWEMQVAVDSCPYTFSGDYAVQFSAMCDDSDGDTKCENYTKIFGDTVSLSTGLAFDDYICDEEIWLIKYDAEAMFYNDSTFLTPIAYDHQYVVGEHRLYVEIVVEDSYINDNGYSILNTKLLNVWLCTITNNGELALDQNNLTSSGCFSSDIDDDGLYHIIVNYNESFTNGARHEDDSFSHIVRFSFIVPDTITSDILYIQTQLGLEFVGKNNDRRLLLEDQNEANQIFDHFQGANVIKSQEFEVDTNANAGAKGKDGTNETISVIISVIGALLLIICVCFVVYKRNHSGELNKHNYGNVVNEQAVVNEIQNNDTTQQSIIENDEKLENV